MRLVDDGGIRNARISNYQPIEISDRSEAKPLQRHNVQASEAETNRILNGVAQVVAQAATKPAEVRPVKGPSDAQSISFERSDRAVDYMFNEMKTNINSQTVRNIKSHLEYADYLSNPQGWKERITAALAIAGGDSPSSHVQAALVEWGLKVRPGGDWDHKRNDKLPSELNLTKGDYHFPIRGDNKHEVYYDIWSNIHYGYVGRAAGIDGQTLQDGAAAIEGIAGRNDTVDVATVQIGIDLWNKYGANMTKEQFHQEVVNRLPDIIRAQQDPSYVEQNKDGWRHVTGIQNGR